MISHSIDSKNKNFSDFLPIEYLNTYYSEIGFENDALLEFYSTCYKHVGQKSKMLEFSGGPTIYSLIKACTVVQDIDFSDFLETNLKEVAAWQQAKSDSFNWDAYIERSLQYELSVVNVSKKQIEERTSLLRSKIKKLMRCDAFSTFPLGELNTAHYDVINVNFVPESITSDKFEWFEMLKKIRALLKSKGTIVMTSITGANFYRVGNKKFPAVNIEQRDILEAFKELGANERLLRSTHINSEHVADHNAFESGYTGMTFVEAIWT